MASPVTASYAFPFFIPKIYHEKSSKTALHHQPCLKRVLDQAALANLEQQQAKKSRLDQVKINQITAEHFYKLGKECEAKKEDRDAFDWYWASISFQEKSDTCYRLGNLYESGRGTQQSDNSASHYYKKAASLGHEDAFIAEQLLALKNTKA